MKRLNCIFGILFILVPVVYCQQKVRLQSLKICDPVEVLQKRQKEELSRLYRHLLIIKQKRRLTLLEALVMAYYFLEYDDDPYSAVVPWEETAEINGEVFSKYLEPKCAMYGRIGYIKMPEFKQNSLPGKIYAYVYFFRLKKAEKFILDLRDNGGGDVALLVQVVKFFLPARPCSVFSIRGKKVPQPMRKYFRPEKEVTMVVRGRASFPQNMVVIINKETCSAAEMMAAALKKHCGAVLLGEKTGGKGTIQSAHISKTGHMYLLTTGKWYTPSGVCVDKNGLEPDIKVKNKGGKDVQLERALQYLRKKRR